jgi:hypothetical protein
VPKAQVECRICTNFLVGPGHAHPEMITRACSPRHAHPELHLDSLKCHFPDFGEKFYRIMMVRSCSIGYSLSLGAPIGIGGPRVLPVRAHSSYATGYDNFLNIAPYRVSQKSIPFEIKRLLEFEWLIFTMLSSLPRVRKHIWIEFYARTLSSYVRWAYNLTQ